MKNSKKILIIRNDHIGDLVLSTAVFREIKRTFPNLRITLIANKLNISLIKKNKNIDEIFELDIPEYKLKCLWDYIKMSLRVRKEKFDIGIDLRGSTMNTFFLLWLSGIKKRIAKTDLNPLIKKLLTNPVEIDYKTHVIDDNIKIIEDGLGIYTKNKNPEIITDSRDGKDVENFLKKIKVKRYICLCPFAGLIKKQWPITNWEEIIKWLESYSEKRKILLIGTKSDKNEIESLLRFNKNSVAVINFNLRKMSLLFKKSDLVITQDGGPMHIAWVSGARLIELHNLFLPWLNKFIPLGKNSHTLYTKNIHMDSISADEVKKEIKKIMK